MTIPGGVNHQGTALGPGLLHPIDQDALMIGLTKIKVKSQCLSARSALGLDIGQGGGAINMWLPDPEKIEIGPIQDKDDLGHAPRRH